MLSFELASGPRTKSVTVSNTGDCDLVLQRVDIRGADGSREHTSVDDFGMVGCSSWPCTINRVLCAPITPSCTSSTAELGIRYSNNDNSSVDLAELWIDTTDLRNWRYVVVLLADDQ